MLFSIQKISLLPLSLAFMLSACSSTPQKTAENSSKAQPLSENQRARLIKAQQEKAQDQADRKRVLAKKQEYIGDNYRAVPQRGGAIESSRPSSVFLAKPGNLNSVSEGQLYAEILDSYQANDSRGFSPRARAYLSRFADGDRRDEVYYMSGIMELAGRNYGVALVNFNRILRDHPEGHKAPAAMFAKGMAFKRMNLAPEAKDVLGRLAKKFPGSPEATRARVELKLLR